jgi:hypothetical protein
MQQIFNLWERGRSDVASVAGGAFFAVLIFGSFATFAVKSFCSQYSKDKTLNRKGREGRKE